MPFLAEYVAGVYRYAVAVASILATIMIIVAGFQWIVSGGNAEAISRAKKRMTGAIVGLMLAVGSYTILYTINPQLVSFESLKINYIETSSFPDELNELTDEDVRATSNWTKANPSWEEMPKLVGVTYGKGSTSHSRADVVRAFTSAAKELNQSGISFFVTSAGRSPEYQYDLMQRKCGCPAVSELPDNVNSIGRTPEDWRDHCSKLKPSGSTCNAAWKSVRYTEKKLNAKEISHTGGNALDISANSGSTIDCGPVTDPKIKNSAGVAFFTKGGKKVGSNLCIPHDQQQIIKTMLKYKFCVGLKAGSKLREPWHFELSPNSVKKSSFCVDATDLNVQKMGYIE